MTLENIFDIKARNSSLKQEALAGFTTFITMAYIAVVNPTFLIIAGVPADAAFFATCVAAAIGSILMGTLANAPIALAPGMGLNAFFAFTIVIDGGYSWQSALAAVFLSGFVFLLLAFFGLRELVISSIPASLKTGSAIGIGFFLAVIGFQNAGIIVPGPGVVDGVDGPFVVLGDLTSPPAALFCLGFVTIVAAHLRGLNSSVLLSIAMLTIIAWVTGISAPPTDFIQFPTSPFDAVFKLDFSSLFELSFLSLVLLLLFVDMFDTTGTLLAVTESSEIDLDQNDEKGLRKALISDSLATMLGALIGTSTTTSYIESTAGIKVGGKTGLVAVVVGIFFLFTLLLFPIFSAIPLFATSPALVFVAILLVGTLSRFDSWSDFSESAPLVITALTMPLAFSIADGLALGLISYVLIRILSLRISEINPFIGFVAFLFLLKFIFA